MMTFHFRLTLIFVLGLTAFSAIDAQSFVFGPKIGPGINFQFWNGLERQALIAPHVDLFIESYAEGQNSSLLAQIGYHVRGSSERRTFIQGPQAIFTSPSYRFNNLSLVLGAKRNFATREQFSSYYMFGLRGEYTVSTNLSDFETLGAYYPNDFYVNKINYGVTIAAGIERSLSELVGAALEVSISPDLSRQYFQPPIPNVTNPWNPNSFTLREQEIRNLSIEISLVLRLLRKVEYL